METTIYDQGITFEELVVFCDSIEVPGNEVQEKDVYNHKEEKIENPIILHKSVHEVKHEILEKRWEISMKVKKMSTLSLKKIFSKYRSYECNDRQTLIFVVGDIIENGEFDEEIEKSLEYKIVVEDGKNDNSISSKTIREIRKLYNIKYIDSKGKENSVYSFNELSTLVQQDHQLPISHIFCRNICLGKVYKNIK